VHGEYKIKLKLQWNDKAYKMAFYSALFEIEDFDWLIKALCFVATKRVGSYVEVLQHLLETRVNRQGIELKNRRSDLHYSCCYSLR
jgi:hypothetical protein